MDPSPAAVCQMSPPCSLGDTSMACNSSRKIKSDICIRHMGSGPGVRSGKQLNKDGKNRRKEGEAGKDQESWDGSFSQLYNPSTVQLARRHVWSESSYPHLVGGSKVKAPQDILHSVPEVSVLVAQRAWYEGNIFNHWNFQNSFIH